ncbi:hypothetical protein ACK3SF_05335 [Candidatus Nanosalina sp. VS9-1]|uniref:hypothetical protein n=1 Tax=Candidatus Nanosalina sp. VS9-1 TaxID=3388566 RepID=UPI0039E062FD
MSELDASEAYRTFDIPEAAHSTVLQKASVNRPWTPDMVDAPGVGIEEDVYVGGILRADPREKQDRHDLLIDGRLDRYRRNIEQGRNRWDLVLVEQDFYEHPDEFNIDSGVDHNRDPADHLRKGDADLLFIDLDQYDIHMVEVKPHEGYSDTSREKQEASPEPALDELDQDQIYIEAQDLQEENQGGGTVRKKSRNLSEAWQTVQGELSNDWTVYHPEFVFGSDVLEASSLSNNTEYALPHSYDQSTGYALGTDEGFEKAEASEDLEILNDTFFRGGIDELLEGKRPEMDRRPVL